MATPKRVRWRIHWGHLAGYLTLVITSVVIVHQIDTRLISSQRGDELLERDPLLTSVPPARTRVFALFIDSLRYRTATNSDLMPHLQQLQKESLCAKMATVPDAVTVPAILSAFTGVDRFRVLGFVDNLWKRRGSIPSLFQQLTDGGRKTAVFSDGTFRQFGSAIQLSFPMESKGQSEQERQNAQVEAALQFFQERSDFDLVISHIGYMDYAAHKYRPGSEEYRKAFGLGDNLVAMLADGVGVDETLVVFGDHGHTDDGRHAYGLNVPTYFCARSPVLTVGKLEMIPIASLRYFFSWALGLPLASEYQGGWYPQALQVAADKLDPSWTKGASSSLQAAEDGVHHLFYLAVILVLGAICYALMTKFFTTSLSVAQRTGVYSALGLAGCALGYLFLEFRAEIHEPQYPLMYQIWGGVLLVAIALKNKVPPAVLRWTILAVPVLICAPTVYRYGFAATWAPVLFVCSILWCVNAVSQRQVAIPTAIGLTAATLLLVQPWFFVDASNFKFSGFIALAPEIAPSTKIGNLMLSGLAFAILFLQRPFRSADNLWSNIAVLGCLGGWLFWRWQGTSTLPVVMAAACFIAASFWHLMSPGSGGGHRDSQILVAMGLIWMMAFLIRVPAFHYDCFLCFLASLRMVSRLYNPPFADGWVAAIAVIVSGWATLAWSAHGLEWHFLYEVLPASFIERHVGWFLPVIAARFILPMVVVRILFPWQLRGSDALWHWIIPCKGFTLLGMLAALGTFAPSSRIYLESVVHLALLLAIVLGCL